MTERHLVKINNLKKSRILAMAVIFCLAVFLPVFSAQASGITAEKVIQLVNAERLANGLSILSENKLLDQAAKFKLEDMIKNDYFAHTSPVGATPWSWFEKSGYDYKYAGENLAINFTNAENQHQAWMASATHRKNILNPSFKEIGLAVAEGKINGNLSVITVQLFGTTVAMAVSNNKPAVTPATKESAVEVQGEENTGAAQALPRPALNGFLPAKPNENIINSEKIDVVHPVCREGICYFNESNQLLNSKKEVSERTAWIAVILVLALSIVVNTITLSQKHSHNPFIAANTIVLMMILTSMVLWQT